MTAPPQAAAAPRPPLRGGGSCTRNRCDAPHYAKGRCQRHYTKYRALRRARGERAPADARPVADHIRQLRARGWSWPMIADAAHTSTPLIHRILAGQVTTLPRDRVPAFLAVPVEWRRTRVSVPAVGTRRRLDGLAWQGWSQIAVARQLGLSPWTFPNSTRTDMIEAGVAMDVAAFFERHAYTAGPDRAYATRSRNRGAIPAAAWDDDIDDPHAVPHLGRDELADRRAATVARLAADGQSAHVIAEAVGMTPHSVRRLLRRAS